MVDLLTGEQDLNRLNTEMYLYDDVVVGTGAAGYNAALRLRRLRAGHVAVVTDGITKGTSRNTGSDKQTYYKISMEGDSLDSVEKMARTYFSGRSMDGEHALIEAAYSARCFYNLVELGVPFPKNKYGEYVGYKTDHDPCTRATSIGPYTSKKMTECLEDAVAKEGVDIYDDCTLVKILTDEGKAYGIIAYSSECSCLKVFLSSNIILATGGPAGMYQDSVYPESQTGASGVAFLAGVKGKNLTEWQCGLASISPRWNVSGSFMQVIPRFVSTEKDMSDEREFLLDYFSDTKELNSKVFLKGYQWPFDVRKVMNGSSIIDILVYQETAIKGRRVFLDFRRNGGGEDFDPSALSEEAREYLKNAGVLFGTPIERLKTMNYPAYSLYLDKGIDIEKNMLEIALCVQHNNGGLSVDENWETNIEGLYAVGEVAGTHGVYRPGGSALNAGQVGSLRAAEHISSKCRKNMSIDFFSRMISKELDEIEKNLSVSQNGMYSVLECWKRFRKRMSEVGSAVRDEEMIKSFLSELKPFILDYSKMVRLNGESDLELYFKLHNLIASQYVYLSAMCDYAENGTGSRGSSLYHDDDGLLPDDSLPSLFRFTLEKDAVDNRVQEVSLVNGECKIEWRDTHTIPERDNFFENVWKAFRQKK